MADSWGGRRRHVARIVAISATGRADVHAHGGHVLVGLGLVLALAAALLVPSSAGWGAPRQEASRRSVIVLAAPGSVSTAESAVRGAGGIVRTQLGIVNGFSADIPASALRRLRAERSVVSITANTTLGPHGKGKPGGGGGGSEPADMGTMYATTLLTGAREYWKAGYTGRGIGIALIDTGVAPVSGLTFAEKVVNGPDLSFESQAEETRYVDTNGHGTHLAGIIAGRADTPPDGSYATDTESFLGMAPDATIVSIKVGNRVGAADVSQVIAAIDWVVQHKDDRGLNIEVLNLAYGTDTRQPYEVDPLAFAAEQAWKHGLVVVTAAGNNGFSRSGSMTSPAYDPYVLAVGATTTNGTVALDDDDVAEFSSSGKSRNPDLVAPGTSIVSLRVPGSYVDAEYGSTGYVGPTLFRGSGTSQAAAVVAGAAALILDQRPSITPDQVKKILKDTASALSGTRPDMQGNGTLNLASALTFKTPRWANTMPTPSTGTGLLEEARGSLHVTNGGIELEGEQDIFGKHFDSAAMAELEASASSWSDGWWNGSEWAGSSWSGSSWSGSSWSASSWSSSSWSGSSWSSSSWSSSSWSSSSWSSSSWSSAYWQ